jgi:hypothetical protein
MRMAEGPPPDTPDLAVRAFIGLFVLGCVLHGFDVMRPEGIKAAAGWWTGAVVLAGFDWYWIKIKTWFGSRFAATANNVATDFRWWALALVVVFAYVAGSDIYRAATGTKDVPQTPAVTSAPAPPATSKPVTSQPTSHVKVYSQAEKEDLRNAMREIAKTVDGHGNDVSMKIEEVLRAWDKLSNSTQPSTIPILLQKLGDLNDSLSTLKNSVDRQDGSLIKQYRSYSEEVMSILNLPQPWQSNAVENLWVMTERFKGKIILVDQATKCGDALTLKSLVQGLDLGLVSFQNAQAKFLDWMAQTKQRIADFRTASL